MAKEKRSFFERLTGSAAIDDYSDSFEEEEAIPAERGRSEMPPTTASAEQWVEEEEGQLSVDVYQTPDHIVIKAIVAGVKPENLDVAITRDMVTIKGRREEQKEVSGDNYFYKELYWGSFSRTVLLPQEVEVDEADATEKHGVLIIKLPKVDKDRQTKLKIKSG